AALAHFLPAAPCARLDAGGDVELHGRVGRDHGADVAPVEHRAARLQREAPLALVEGLADRGMDRNPAGEPSVRLAAQRRVGEQAVGKRRGGERVSGIVRVAAGERHLTPDRTVEQPGVEVRQPEVRRKRAGDGAFSGGGGSVDGDDHACALVGPRAIENRLRAAYLAGAGGHVLRADPGRPAAFKTGTARQLAREREAAVAWIILIIAGALETVWAYYMKLS